MLEAQAALEVQAASVEPLEPVAQVAPAVQRVVLAQWAPPVRAHDVPTAQHNWRGISQPIHPVL